MSITIQPTTNSISLNALVNTASIEALNNAITVNLEVFTTSYFLSAGMIIEEAGGV